MKFVLKIVLMNYSKLNIQNLYKMQLLLLKKVLRNFYVLLYLLIIDGLV